VKKPGQKDGDGEWFACTTCNGDGVAKNNGTIPGRKV